MNLISLCGKEITTKKSRNFVGKKKAVSPYHWGGGKTPQSQITDGYWREVGHPPKKAPLGDPKIKKEPKKKPRGGGGKQSRNLKGIPSSEGDRCAL